jgi:tripartite-type tricarboxylate transporter receptor subunit TctC
MPATTRRAFLGAAALLAAPPLVAPRSGAAQTIARPARIIVGFPAGGSSDVVARLYAERLRMTYATQIVVENRTGAAGRIAVEAVKAAIPDGETILQTPASMLTLQPHVFPRQVRYDGLTDLIPVSTVVTFPFALAVPANHPARDFAGFVAWARTQADIPYASPAAGASPHFMGVMLAKAIGATMTHVSYRGAAPAVQDLIAGRIQAFIGVLGDVAPQNGQGLRILAVSSAARNPRYPGIPTFAELGHPGLTKDEWFGMLLPAGTPQPVVQGLFEAIRRAAAEPAMREALEKLDYAATTSDSPAAFAARIRREREEWAVIVRESGVQLDDG